MQDPHAFAPDLEHVEVAVGVEGIAHVVARDHNVDAGGLRRIQSSPVFSDRSNAPPGNPSGLAATAVPIAHAGAGGRLGLTRLR